MMRSINPTTNQLIKEYQTLSDQEASLKINKAHTAFTTWKETNIQKRATYMHQMADTLTDNKEQLATLMTQEMGKVSKEAVAEIEKCTWVCKYYAEHASHFLSDEKVDTEVTNSFITYQPLGVICAVMPWNFPFWQVFRFAAPTIMAGNTAILKHASNVPACALAIEDLFNKAGFPDNIFTTLLIDSSQMAKVIEHPNVQAVTLTGSTNAGKAVAAKAGECLKKTVLELGGSDPYIILEDADIEHAAEQCTTSRLLNAGQSCIAAKRFIVVEEVYETFLIAFKQNMASKTMGDPAASDTHIGPQATIELRDQLHKQVQASIEQGAKCILGGTIPDMAGAYYPPTILTNIKPGMPAYDEELFGPVASVIKVKDEQQAIEIANDSQFGLGGAVFTQNTDRGTQIAKYKINSGACTVNGFTKSDPRLPFGGIKQSGYGRELSHSGIREFINIKTIVVD